MREVSITFLIVLYFIILFFNKNPIHTRISMEHFFSKIHLNFGKKTELVYANASAARKPASSRDIGTGWNRERLIANNAQ